LQHLLTVVLVCCLQAPQRSYQLWPVSQLVWLVGLLVWVPPHRG
jgi:hypothetical protein